MQFLSFIAGIALLFLAIFAVQIGLDHDSDWGSGRALLLILGIVFLAFSTINRQRRIIIQRAVQTTLRRVPWKAVTAALSMLVLACTSAYALWYTSNGKFPNFDRIGNTYVALGDAFAHGQVALRELPDPRLIALDDPYTVSQRTDIPYLWDASYYQGRYYLYWGPTPALLYAAIQVITGAPPVDQLGLLLAAIGLQFLTLLLLWRWRQQFFPSAPGFSIPLFILVSGVNMPLVHLLGRPEIYETSILAGQFFLFLGVWMWQRADETSGAASWVLTGIAWGLAIASRYNLVLSVSIFVVVALARILSRRVQHTLPWKPIVLLLAPFAIIALALGWYNFARFGNVLETGLRYQLTVQVDQERYFSLSYLPSNLYTYLAYPLQVRNTVPFFFTPLFQESLLPGWASVPPGKLFDEVLVGLGYSTPFLLLLAPAIFSGIATVPARRTGKDGRSPAWAYLWFSFALAGLTQFAFLLVYYYTAMRFQADIFTLCLFTICLGVWALDERLRTRSVWRTLLWIVVMVLAVSSAMIAFFGAFDVPPQFFRLQNLSAYENLLSSVEEVTTRIGAGIEWARSFLRLLAYGL